MAESRPTCGAAADVVPEPRHFGQHEALLRVHGPRLRGRDPKRRTVEAELVRAQGAAAERRKANADLWLAVAPTTAPKKARGPPKDRSLS